jgi:hypothetical protein
MIASETDSKIARESSALDMRLGFVMGGGRNDWSAFNRAGVSIRSFAGEVKSSALKYKYLSRIFAQG